MIADIIHKVSAETLQSDSQYRIRASLSGLKRCARQMFYWGLNYPHQSANPRLAMVMDDSSWHEELTADWIQKSAFNLSSRQMQVAASHPDYDFQIPGRIDGIITDMLDNEYLWEHKAINHFSFQELEKGGLPDDYIAQCAIYLRGLHEVSTISQCLLLIKNKNTAQYLEYLLYYDYGEDQLCVVEMIDSTSREKKKVNLWIKNITKDSFQRFYEVKNYIETKTLPKRQYNYDDWQCEYCRYSEACWTDYQQEFASLATNYEFEQDVVDLCAYYLETNMHILEMKKEKEKLKKEILTIMDKKGVREGSAGLYLIENKLIESKKIDPSLIPFEELSKYEKACLSERLTIRKAKNKKKLKNT